MIRLLPLAAALYLAVSAFANAAPDWEALRQGDMRKLSVHAEAQPVSEAAMETPEGDARALAEWEGKHVLLNFWATWCAPCREEMPSLDNLQAALGGDDFEVVTLATGRNTLTGIERFFDETGVENLPILLDPRSAVARDMAVLGLPITVLIDPEGNEVARLRGDAHWDSPEALALIEAWIAD